MKLKGTAFKGIDISHFKAEINLSGAAADSIKVCCIKATEGEHSCDAECANLYKKAKAAGLKIGFYHFFHTGGCYSAAAQAQNFLKVLTENKFDCLPVVDVEMDGYHGGDKTAVTKDVLKFAEIVKAKTGNTCILYASTSFIAEHFTENIAVLPLWVAHYGVSAPGENGIYGEYVGWQYTGSAEYGGCSEVDMDYFCDAVFINAAKPTVVASKVKKDANADVYRVCARPYDWNAAAKADFDVRDKNGNTVEGHEVTKGDKITIIGVDYQKQLAEVVYPVSGGFMHGYINNLQKSISDRWHFKWQNGSTDEKVYSADGKEIGTIFAHEKATPLFKSGEKTAVLYDTSKGEETKFGFVVYGGGFKK